MTNITNAELESEQDDESLTELAEILADSSVDIRNKPIGKPYNGSLTSISKPLVDVAYDSEVWLSRIAIELKKIRKILDREMKKAS